RCRVRQRAWLDLCGRRDRLDQPGAFGVPAAPGVAQVPRRAGCFRHTSDRCRLVPALVREASWARYFETQGPAFVSRPAARGPGIRAGAHERLRGLGPRPSGQSGVLAAACSSKTFLIAASPAETIACIISRRALATSASVSCPNKN